METETGKITKYVESILFAIIVIWGLNTPVMKIGLMAVSPLVYNAFRLVIAAVLSLVALLVTKHYKPMPWRDIKQIVVVSVFGFFLNQVFVMYGMERTTAGNAAMVFATLPVLVALINRLLKIEHISRQMAFGIIVSLAGVLFIVLGSDKEFSLTGPHLVGAILLLIGQFCYGYYTVLFRRLTDEYSALQIITIVLVVSAVFYSLIALPTLLSLQWAAISATAWYSIVFSAILALSLANLGWVWAVGILGSTKASLYQNLCPIFSIAFAWVYLDETFGLLQAVGAAVTFLGLFLTRNQAY